MNAMGKYTGEFREKKFGHSNEGAYIQVYQRPNEKVQLDLNFFDDDKNLRSALRLQTILEKAIDQAIAWDNE
jgi:hypothetical protein